MKELTFEDLNLSDEIMSALAKMNVVRPTTVQQLAIKREQAADLKDLIGEMKLAGVTKQEIMKIIEEVYG